MSPLEVHNPGLHDLIAPDAPIERVAGGLGFTEGPVWRGTYLLFSDIPNKRIVRCGPAHAVVKRVIIRAREIVDAAVAHEGFEPDDAAIDQLGNDESLLGDGHGAG